MCSVLIARMLGNGQTCLNTCQLIRALNMQDVRDLGLILDSRVPLVVIETFEEKRALDMLMRVATKKSKNIYRWSCTGGLSRQSLSCSGPAVLCFC